MTYLEFKENYKWMLDKYFDTRNLWDETGEKKITLTTVRQRRNGSRWVDVEATTKKISYENYANIIDAVPFFRGLGGKETVKTTYTKYGLIPYKTFSTSPSGDQRTVRTFVF